MADQDLSTFAPAIDKEISALRERLTEVFFANMEKYGIVSSGQLKGATRINQDQISDDLSGGLQILTLKYGILLQAKRRFVVKAPAARILEWVRALGVARFKYVPGYKGKVPTEDIAIRRIAWGIKQHGRAKQLGADAIIASKSSTRTSDPWLYRDFFREVKTFQETLAKNISPDLARDVANAMRRQLTSR